MTNHTFKSRLIAAVVGVLVATAASDSFSQPAPTRGQVQKHGQELSRVEERLAANAQYLKKYYGRPDQLKQTSKDITLLAMLKVEYLDRGKSPEERALGKKAASLGPKVEIQAREIYASSLEEHYMKGGMDVRIQSIGPEKRTLRIAYALMSQPLVYKFQNEVRLDEQATTFGFRKLLYTNGFESSLGKTWTVDLKR